MRRNEELIVYSAVEVIGEIALGLESAERAQIEIKF